MNPEIAKERNLLKRFKYAKVRCERANKTPPFKEEYCDKLLKHMSEGYTYEGCAGHFHCSITTFRTWEKEQSSWAEAKEIGEALSRVRIEKIGLSGMQGKIPGFNNPSWALHMISRYGWRTKPKDDQGEQKAIQLNYTKENLQEEEPELKDVNN